MSAPGRAPVYRQGQAQQPQGSPRPASYEVRKGDTLHSIAWRFSIDYRNLAKWNALKDPNKIYVGQKLRLSAPAVKPSPSKQTLKKEYELPTKRQPAPSSKTAVAAAPEKPIVWLWPANGEVQSASSALGTKGIEILGRRGQEIRAAAGGKVVYSGSGLRGYGRLIIVKHSEEYLSAYAHNERLLVGEGAIVKSGQQIAEMGDSDAKRVMLHFEIRRDGKAVEPLKLLPRR